MTSRSFSKKIHGAWKAGCALALLAIPFAFLSACPFCTMQGQTLTGDVNAASLVLYGTLKNAKLLPGGDGLQGTTELEIDDVIKDHEIRGKKKLLVLPRYVPPSKDAQYKYLVLCDVFKNKIDPYRGVAFLPESKVGTYLNSALKLKDAPATEKLSFFFNWLDSPDPEISNDSYKEFGNADYKDFKAMASALPPEKIAGWLKDKATPGFRLGLYASMLGHCGKKEHAKILADLLDDKEKRLSSSIDGVLASLVMLDKETGWNRINSILKNPKEEFMLRFAALKAARFFHDYRPDLISQTMVIEAYKPLLDQGDIADLAIEDLRKWKAWSAAETVLAIRSKEAGKVAIVRRAILRYALRCPGDAAKSFVESARAEDKRAVEDAEELLKLEETPPSPAPADKKISPAK
jgi:hypothetical protein